MRIHLFKRPGSKGQIIEEVNPTFGNTDNIEEISIKNYSFLYLTESYHHKIRSSNDLNIYYFYNLELPFLNV